MIERPIYHHTFQTLIDSEEKAILVIKRVNKYKKYIYKYCRIEQIHSNISIPIYFFLNSPYLICGLFYCAQAFQTYQVLVP